MLRGTVLLALCTSVLVLQVNASMFDFAKLIKSLRNSKDHSNWRFSAAYKDSSSYEVSQDILNEFATYVDHMTSQDIIVSLEDETDQSKEMKLELDELRKSMGNVEFEHTLKPGQRPAIDCGKFGCCEDQSKADSTGKVGCAKKLCADVFLKTCNDIYSMSRYKRDRECRRPVVRKYCPYTCNRCKLPADPLQLCQNKFPGGCCWDGKPATGPNGRGCRPCKDEFERACTVFKHVYRGCLSNSWRRRTFMNTRCPQTCGKCRKV